MVAREESGSKSHASATPAMKQASCTVTARQVVVVVPRIPIERRKIYITGIGEGTVQRTRFGPI